MAQVCAPAIRLARDGFEVPSNLARVWSRRVPVLQRNPVAARLFLKAGGLPYREGDVFRQPELADSLALYADGGADRFLNQTLTRDLTLLQEAGSRLTAQDFQTYRPIDAEHIHTRYRGWDVWSIGRQGYGFLVAQTLELLQAYDLKSMSAADRWATMLVAQQMAFKDQRDEALGPGASLLLDGERIQNQGQRVRVVLQSGKAAGLFAAPPAKPGVPQDTTHISVVDAQGMVASMTESIGPHFGTGFASPGGYLFAHSYQMVSG
jgi:gamma-glutamyltranspeptidase/glutathione hydrolase